MNNLFIMHTQYNLILACGVIESKFKNDSNDLLLHAEFKLNKDFEDKLKKVFSNVYIAQDKFKGNSTTLKNEIDLFIKVNKSKDVIKNKYDNIFLTQEDYYDTLILSKISKNCNFTCIAIEEDAYFSLDKRYNNLSIEEYRKSVKTSQNIKFQCLNAFRKILFGKNIYMYTVYSYGSSPIFSDVFVMYPNYVRKELKNKNLHEVTPKMILSGVNILYGDIKYDIKQSEKYVMFFFDLISRYKNRGVIEDFINILVNFCDENNLCFMYKYHPRETQSFELIEENKCCVKLPTIIPSEKILADLYGKEVIVVGNASTAIQVSAKLGYNTFSISSIERMDNEYAIEAFRKMGIFVPNSMKQLIKEINEVNKED